jgi:hypothetical protein
MSKIYYYEGTDISIFLIETFITSIILSLSLGNQLHYHWAMNLIITPIIMLLLVFLFIKWSITRYLITLFYSILYGFLGYYIGRLFQDDGISVAIVFAYVAYFVSISFHEMEYRALKS